MRAFWIVILLMVIGVGAYALVGNRGTGTPAAATRESTMPQPPLAPPAPSPAASDPVSVPESARAPAAQPADLVREARATIESLRRERADAMMKVQALRDQVTQVELSIERMPDRADVLSARLAELREQVRSHELRADELGARIAAIAAAMPEVESPAPVATAAPADTKAPIQAGAQAGVQARDAGIATTDNAAKTTPAPDAAATANDLAAFATPARIAGFEVTPSKIESRDQGGVLIDARFVMKGSGTAADPFVVPWEMLISAEEGFAPQAGRKQIPQRVAMLDGKYVSVKGYVAFPLAMDEPRELLAMLNQWDGCCIGVPPTPYDAIEVQLKAGAKGDDRFAISGEVAGRFSVKPYVVGDWLVGMYVMENAEFKARGAPGT